MLARYLLFCININLESNKLKSLQKNNDTNDRFQGLFDKSLFDIPKFKGIGVYSWFMNINRTSFSLATKSSFDNAIENRYTGFSQSFKVRI